MEYEFDCVQLGRCKLIRSTSGKHGFCSPKFFTVSATQNGAKFARTYRHIDKLLVGHWPANLTDDTLCRIAIAQFLLRHAVEMRDNIDLDVTVPPFSEAVLSMNGGKLRKARMVPSYVANPSNAATTRHD
jgi:hypothetical protein